MAGRFRSYFGFFAVAAALAAVAIGFLDPGWSTLPRAIGLAFDLTTDPRAAIILAAAFILADFVVLRPLASGKWLRLGPGTWFAGRTFRDLDTARSLSAG